MGLNISVCAAPRLTQPAIGENETALIHCDVGIELGSHWLPEASRSKA
ncbi:MAG: hypothetical protein P8P54_14720 [Pseudomonadales bacterium]|nr:hypothetical protein [Pseudomonadales bacterium]